MSVTYRKDLSRAVEDYLKAIYELQRGRQQVSTSALAERLGFASASVTGMLKKLHAQSPSLCLLYTSDAADE